MPRSVKIGTTIFLSILGLILVWSLYYNQYLVTSGWVTTLTSEVHGEGPETKIEYFLTILQNGDQHRVYRIPYADAAGIQPGDRVQLRRHGEGRARLVRSRRPNLAEMISMAQQIVEARVKEVDRSDPLAQNWSASAEVIRILKPGQSPVSNHGELRIPLVIDWLNQSDASLTLDLSPGEPVLLFLDGQGEIWGGASGVVSLEAPSGNVKDVELSINLPKDSLLADVQKMINDFERFAR